MVVNHIDAETVEEIFYDIPYIVDYFITDDDDEPELFGDSTSERAWPEYESVSLREDCDFSDDERLNDCNCTGPNCKEDEFDECDKFDECGSYNEDEDFDECEKFESVRPRRRSRKLVSARKLLERRKGCCPPKRVKLSEALKIDRNTIKKATQKALNEKRVINAKKSNFEKLKKQLGEKKYNFIIEALNNKRTKLYTNKNINGKNMTEYTDKQLYNLMKTVNEQIKKYEKSLSSLNESLSIDEKVELSDKINNKKRLLNILDEELTYRLTVKKMLKESDENPLEPLPVGPDAGNADNGDNTDNSGDADNADNGDNADNDNTDDGSNDPEEDETAELESIVITFDTQDAAEEFIDACVEAGIPEDVIELEDEEPEAEGDETEGEGDETEGDDEENTEGDEDTNESQHYDRFRRLLEADDSDETEGDETEGDDTEGNDEENAEGDDEGSEDDEKTFKVVLRDTDYIDTLAQVLNDQYGISQEELEDSIGGEIVDEENADKDDSDDDNSDENSGEGSKGDDAIDAMTPEELDNLFNGE